MSNRGQWVRAFARQADADFRAWEHYSEDSHIAPAECHRLQFLQMACEKLCKAYLLNTKETPVDNVTKSHGFVKKNLSLIVRQELSYNDGPHSKIQRQFNQFAHEIEVLSPAQDKNRRPDNCEYPWEQGSQVVSPLDHKFTLSDLLIRQSGANFLKALRSAINRVLADSTSAEIR